MFTIPGTKTKINSSDEGRWKNVNVSGFNIDTTGGGLRKQLASSWFLCQ
jgi:hypothetical protein